MARDGDQGKGGWSSVYDTVRRDLERAEQVRAWRMDEGCSWRMVAGRCWDAWGHGVDPAWDRIPTNQLAGMALCIAAGDRLCEEVD